MEKSFIKKGIFSKKLLFDSTIHKLQENNFFIVAFLINDLIIQVLRYFFPFTRDKS